MRFDSQILRIASLVTYSLFLTPGFNIILPVLLILVLHEYTITPTIGTNLAGCARGGRWQLRPWPMFSPLVLLMISALIIACTEHTLWNNKQFQDKGESEWGFGQTLAIFVAVLPALRDLSEVVSKRQGEAQAVADVHLNESIGCSDILAIEEWINAGANPNVRTRGWWPSVCLSGATLTVQLSCRQSNRS
jgi:hypothetical protein